MTIVYHDEDGDLSHLDGKTVAVIGYSNMGRPMALNLRDSDIEVIVGTRTEESRLAAADDGFSAHTIEEAVKKAPVIFMLLPDETMAAVYLEQISPYLKRDSLLVFSSAYSITFGFIEPPPFVDVALIAPRALAANVRERFECGEGFYSFISVGQDASGKAWDTLLALAKAIGTLRAGAFELSFEREAELDLFNEQTVLPLLYHVMTTAARLLLEKGYPPEVAFTELYISGELSHTLGQAAERGLLNALRQMPLTAQYGTLSRLERFTDLKLERLMEITLDEIHSAAFAKEWMKEYADGYRRLRTMLKNQESLDIWELEQQTLDMLGREVDDDF